jgi:vacuolar-type H+-ATPase subunit D/Vma8
MKVEIDQEQVEAVVVASLKENRRHIQPYYQGVPMYDQDPKMNKQMVKEMKDAFTKVLEWYGVYK